MKFLRRATLILLGGITVALIAAVLFVVALSHGWQRERLSGELERQLASTLQTPVAIQGINGLLHEDFVIEGLELGPAGAPWGKIERVRVVWRELSLFPLHVGLERIEIKGPHLDWDRSSPLPWGSQAPEEDDTPSALSLEIGEVHVRDATLSVRDGSKRELDLASDAALFDLRLRDGALSTPKVQADGNVNPWLDDGPPPNARFHLEGALAETSWRLGKLSFEGPGLVLNGTGRGDFRKVERAALDLSIDSVSGSAGRFLPGVPLRGGSLEASFDIAGRFTALEGGLRADAIDLAYGDRKVGDLALSARSQGPGKFRIETFEITGGDIALRALPGAKLSLGEEMVEVADWVLAVGPSGVLALSGSLPYRDLGEEGVSRWLKDRRFKVAVDAQELSIETLTALAPNAPLRAVGHISSDLEIAGASDGVRSKGWVALSLERLHNESNDFGRGSAKLQLGPALDMTVETFDWTLNDTPIRIAPGSALHLEEKRLTLRDVAVESDAQRIALAGAIDAAAFHRLEVAIDTLELAWLKRKLSLLGVLEVDEAVAGTLSGILALNGEIKEPAFSGALRVTGLAAAEMAIDRVDLELRSPDQYLEFSSRWQDGDRVPLELQGRVDRARLFADPSSLAEAEASELTLKALRFDLSILEPFLPPTVRSLSGVLDADVVLRGGSPPRVERGEFSLEEGELDLEGLGAVINPIEAKGHVSPQGIALETLHLGPPEARIDAEFLLGWPGSSNDSLDGTVRFAAYTLARPGLAKGSLSGEVALAGRLSAPDLRGDLTLRDVEIQLPEADSAELKEIRVRAKDGNGGDGTAIREEQEQSPLDPLALDLNVILERDSWARGRGVEAELEGKFRAKKRAGRPLILSGDLRTVRGTYEIYGRRFQVKKGHVILDGAKEIDPILDLHAQHRIRDIRITAILEGRLSEPTLRFESQPDLSETDIASYLLIGRPGSEAGAGDQIAVESAARQMAAGIAGKELDRVLGRKLPVDLIDVRMEQGEAEDKDLAVGVGKYVGERLFLRYDRRFGREAVDEIRAEYELTPNWSVESGASSDGAAGADILFNLDY